jgi:hypothetical protein
VYDYNIKDKLKKNINLIKDKYKNSINEIILIYGESVKKNKEEGCNREKDNLKSKLLG